MRNRLVHVALALGLGLGLFGVVSAAVPARACESRAWHANDRGWLHSSNNSVFGVCVGGGSNHSR